MLPNSAEVGTDHPQHRKRQDHPGADGQHVGQDGVGERVPNPGCQVPAPVLNRRAGPADNRLRSPLHLEELGHGHEVVTQGLGLFNDPDQEVLGSLIIFAAGVVHDHRQPGRTRTAHSRGRDVAVGRIGKV